MQNTGGAISDQQLVRWEEERGREGRTAKGADYVKEPSPAGINPVSRRYHDRTTVSDGGRDTTPGGVPPLDRRRHRPAYSGIGHFQLDWALPAGLWTPARLNQEG